MDEGIKEEERRVQQAEADAKIAEAKAREEAAKQKVKDQKSKNREKAATKIRKMPKKSKLIFLVVLVAVIVLVAAFLPGIISSFGKGTTVSEATLKKAVEISKLSTAEFTYNGIAEKIDDNGNAVYYIYYEATADAGIDMEKIQFRVDEGQKLITITLPSITVDNPVIDESSMEYLPHDANIDLKEVLEICKEDVQREISESANIKDIAIGNMKSTLEALLLPLIGDSGYEIYWEDATDSIEMSGTGETNEAGEANEAN